MQNMVSVIVPNYNYSKFIQRRLYSIINQSIKPSEIIFLDDCSTDDSVSVAEQILSNSGIPYRIIINAVNQGVFKQWLKGIEFIKFDYFWIAEADDYCELNFLEKLLPAFNDNNVVISYSKSKYINLKNIEFCDENEYKSKFLDVSHWNENYVNNQSNEIENYLSVMNTIPNVSAALFNKQNINLNLINELVCNYSKAGDWLFYILSLSSMTSNKISYCKEKLNYYMRHEHSVYIAGSVGGGDNLFTELLTIYQYIVKNFDLLPEIKEKIFRNIYEFLFCYNLNVQNEILLIELQSYLRPHDFVVKLVHDVTLLRSKNKSIINVIKSKINKKIKKIKQIIN